MRNGLAVFTTVCMTTLAIGCGSNSTAPAGKPVAGKKAEKKAWSLQLQAKCGEEVEAGKCLAGYGFTLSSDGKWKTGKSIEGYERSGELSKEEVSALDGAMEKALKGSGQTLSKIAMADADETPPGGFANEAPGQPGTGDAASGDPAAPGSPGSDDAQAQLQSEDTVTLSLGAAAPQILIKTIGGNINSSLSSQDEAKLLYTSIRTLAQRYTQDFPNGCVDGVPVLRSLIASVQSCSTDAECTYVSELAPVDADYSDAITTDRGTLVNPLAVANKGALESNMDKLNALFNDVEVSCGEKFIREDAQGAYKSFMTGGKAAQCKSNVCQIAAGIEIQ